MKATFTSLLIALITLCSCTKQPQIITTDQPIADGEWQCFTKEFTLLSGRSAELKIAADTKYLLYVNGELVVREGGLKRGPNPTDSYCDVFTEIPNLKFGKNRVAVLVQYYGRNSFSHRPSSTAGLYFDLTTFFRFSVPPRTLTLLVIASTSSGRIISVVPKILVTFKVELFVIFELLKSKIR